MASDQDVAGSRRDFLIAGSSIALAAVVVNYLDLAEAASADLLLTDAQPSNPSRAWRVPLQTASERYEGLAKVTGQKIFARDLRARDLKGWPTQEIHVAVLRAIHADRTLLALDQERLLQTLGLSSIKTALDVDSLGAKADGFFVNAIFAKVGQVPRYLGQPIALLYFRDLEAFLAAKAALSDLSSYQSYGEPQSVATLPSYAQSRIVRYTDAAGQELFSYAKDGMFSPPWEKADASGSVNARAGYFAERIKADVQAADWQSFSGSYQTQGVDPMFMEPECGLSWYNPTTQELQITWGTQSPLDDGESCAAMLANAKAVPVRKVVVNASYPGGGFGGRDRSEFPLVLALAASFAPASSIRIIHSRFDQFQAGLKRHPATTKVSLTIDKSGAFQALHTDIKLDGGGQNNYSFAVQNVSARNASSGYRFPRSWVDSEAIASAAVPAGSMRGFGSFQSAFALECLIDEAAVALNMDPIDLRLRNIITAPEAVHTGTIPAFRLHSDLLLRAAADCFLWKNREREQKRRSTTEKAYGVGVALAVKSYGKNPGDACPAMVAISPTGEISMFSNCIEMGNGAATSLPLCISDILGRKADRIKLGVTTEFEAMTLIASKPKDQAAQDEAAKDPRWVPSRAISTAASASAYQMRHAVREAAKLLWQHGLWPAALSLWGQPAAEAPPLAPHWQNGALLVPGRRALTLRQLAAEAHRLHLVTGAMIHSYYRTAWAKASFAISGQDYLLDIDALALRHGKAQDFVPILRSKVDFPPLKNLAQGANTYTPYVVVVAVEVDKKSGAVQVVAGETFLECGQIIQKDLVEGQMHGAFAMGIGQALLEYYPTTVGGPGQGGWNLHRYELARSRHCALGKVKFHIVRPEKVDPPKGMAEVVFNAVPPAIANAVAHATGKRFYQLPILPEHIKEAIL